jgi:hypothetical protein
MQRITYPQVRVVGIIWVDEYQSYDALVWRLADAEITLHDAGGEPYHDADGFFVGHFAPRFAACFS